MDIIRPLGAVIMVVVVSLRAPRGASLAHSALPIVGLASIFLAIGAVVSLVVRPKLTVDGRAFIVLTPLGSPDVDTARVTNQNPTLPGRMVIATSGISWVSKRGGRLAWAHAAVSSARVDRVFSFRPLGYLTLDLINGDSFTSRVFQPGEIMAALRSCGYDAQP